MKLILREKLKKLTTILSMAALDGNVAILASTGMFQLKNSPLFAFSIIAGPCSIALACLLGGALKERMVAALVAGLIATFLIIFAATMGPQLLHHVNMKLVRIFGGIAVLFIALSMIGLKLPNNLPTYTIIGGVIIALIYR
ncbi:MAG: hypothetical protein ISS23_02585 [Nanoarchaeota archaeon]|nr:hypothetical protein [Nanoarchaeota archaeon]